MNNTGVKVCKKDLDKLVHLANQGWRQGEPMITFSVGEGYRKDQATVDARIVCHQLALDYGLPEIEGYYGIDKNGEFVTI